MKTNMTISLCNIELNLMISVAKHRYTPVSHEDATLDLEAIEVGLDLGFCAHFCEKSKEFLMQGYGEALKSR
ncbi:hypothetical protein, partial [Vibrio owensii]|uniref:hypothetical protein n=1 Tax=Vibrio owensii TaxID=696485 RepID=UPI00391A5940